MLKTKYENKMPMLNICGQVASVKNWLSLDWVTYFQDIVITASLLVILDGKGLRKGLTCSVHRKIRSFATEMNVGRILYTAD